MLKKGSTAPNFTLESSLQKEVSLSDYHGSNVVLVFYPADWSPVCGDQIALYNEMLSEFEKHNAQIVGISVDSHWCHKAYAKDRNLKFPLLADFHPKGNVSTLYDVYNQEAGKSRRALFVIDTSGKIYWSEVFPNSENPGADGILKALQELS